MSNLRNDRIALAEAQTRSWLQRRSLESMLADLASLVGAASPVSRTNAETTERAIRAMIERDNQLRAFAARVQQLRAGPGPGVTQRIKWVIKQACLKLVFPGMPDVPEFPQASERGPRAERLTPRPGVIARVLFVSGEPETPGTIYRCDRNAAACRRAGYEASTIACAAVGPSDIEWADVVVLWRAEYSAHVKTMITMLRDAGKTVIFDIDDLVFLSLLARIEFLDGIRLSGATEARIEQVFTNMRATMLECDLSICTTEPLAHQIRLQNQRLVQVMPNIFNDDTLLAARQAARRKEMVGPDGLVRIGYAAGSRTHQRDFRMVAPALARVLRDRATVRLVLFRIRSGDLPLLLVEEFPDLAPYHDRIEWLDFVPLDQLPAAMAAFDITIAPLEIGDIFCECKSEVKFLESALAGVPVIASATQASSRIIEHGTNGFLAVTEQDWEDSLRLLVGDRDLRVRTGRNALLSVLWEFSTDRQARQFQALFRSLQDEASAAVFGADLIETRCLANHALPVIPEAETLFRHDVLGVAQVTIVITSYNYEKHVLEALESVMAQTLDILDLVVVDDGSSDESVPLIVEWSARHAARFNRLVVMRSVHNAGLGGARNIGMAEAETPFVLHLDADNRLLPQACAVLSAALSKTGAAYAYPILRQFNDLGSDEGEPELMGNTRFHPLLLVPGNYIDAMAMITKWAWIVAGGYYVARDAMGWEDFDLWCRLAELGLGGTQVPEILAEYRRHDASMTNGVTEQSQHKARVVSLVEARHPWLHLTAPGARPRS